MEVGAKGDESAEVHIVIFWIVGLHERRDIKAVCISLHSIYELVLIRFIKLEIGMLVSDLTRLHFEVELAVLEV